MKSLDNRLNDLQKKIQKIETDYPIVDNDLQEKINNLNALFDKHESNL